MTTMTALILAFVTLTLARQRRHHHPTATNAETSIAMAAISTGRMPHFGNTTTSKVDGSTMNARDDFPIVSVSLQQLPSGSTNALSSTANSAGSTTTVPCSVEANPGSCPSNGSGDVKPVVATIVSAPSLTFTTPLPIGGVSGPSSGPSNFSTASTIQIPPSAISLPTPDVGVSTSAPSTVTVAANGNVAGKKGLSFNTASLLSAFAGDGMTWAYNWMPGPDGNIPSSVEYVPMCWGLSSTDSWAAAATSAIAAGSKHVLSFNEPDLSSQSNIDPITAAKNHIQFLNPLSKSAEVGSPAITNGQGTTPPMGIDSLQQFFDACQQLCQVEFVAFHWYDAASNFASFQNHTQNVVNAAQRNGVKKVWLTEYGATGSDADVANFITQSIEYLDGIDAVERYAYFMAADGILLSGDRLSTLGQAYVG